MDHASRVCPVRHSPPVLLHSLTSPRCNAVRGTAHALPIPSHAASSSCASTSPCPLSFTLAPLVSANRPRVAERAFPFACCSPRLRATSSHCSGRPPAAHAARRSSGCRYSRARSGPRRRRRPSAAGRSAEPRSRRDHGARRCDGGDGDRNGRPTCADDACRVRSDAASIGRR